MIDRKLCGAEVREASESVSCGAVEEAEVIAHFGVDVPTPSIPAPDSIIRFDGEATLPIYTGPPGTPILIVSALVVVSMLISGVPVVLVAIVHEYGVLFLMVVVELFAKEMAAGSASVVPSKVNPALPVSALVPLQYATWFATPLPLRAAPPLTHPPLIAKHPLVRLIPPAKLEVAVPVTSIFRSVVEPVLLSSVKIGEVVVANVVGEDVEMYNMLLMARKLNGAEVRDASERVS